MSVYLIKLLITIHFLKITINYIIYLNHFIGKRYKKAINNI